MSDEQGRPPIGSVGEEAAKLLEALQGWAKDSGHQYGDAAGAAAAGAGEFLRNVNEHVATGAEECTYCPVCKMIHAVRTTSPEVRQHLSSAASSLLQAAAGMLATQAPDRSGTKNEAPVERIDLDDTTEWEDD